MPERLRATALFSGPPIGLGMLSAALILAVMVTPFISSLAREVLKAVPRTQREGAYALGATQWEAIRVALAYGRTGIVGAIMLGFGRALGETMAVTMVIGNNPTVSWSLFAPQYTMAAVIANEFTEATDDLHLHALIEIGLVLFIITLCGERAVAHAHLEHEPAGRWRSRKRRLEPAMARRGGMTRNERARAARSSRTIAVALCALSVLVALIPLAFILFFVVTQGHSGVELGFLHADAGARRRDRRRHGQRDRRHADVDGARRRCSRFRSAS